MANIHIDDFYKDAAKALVMLYKHFPRKQVIYVEDISGTDTPDEFGLHSERHQACFSTLLWLAEHGYISYQETHNQETLEHTTLTHKAFVILSTPQINHQLGANDNYQAQLVTALKDKSSLKIAQVMQSLMLHTEQHH